MAHKTAPPAGLKIGRRGLLLSALAAAPLAGVRQDAPKPDDRLVIRDGWVLRASDLTAERS